MVTNCLHSKNAQNSILVISKLSILCERLYCPRSIDFLAFRTVYFAYVISISFSYFVDGQNIIPKFQNRIRGFSPFLRGFHVKIVNYHYLVIKVLICGGPVSRATSNFTVKFLFKAFSCTRLMGDFKSE